MHNGLYCTKVRHIACDPEEALLHNLLHESRYRTTTWKQYNAALKARGSLTAWVDKRMTWFAAASNKRRRSPKFSTAAIQCCLTLKNLFALALRQTTTLVQSALDLRGLSWPAPDFSTLRKRQLDLKAQVPHSRSQAGLYLLTDSTEIKFFAEGEWTCKKHDPERRRQWCKLQTLQIRAICMTINNASDACVLPNLLKQIPEDDVLVSLKGDGAHDTPLVHEAVMRRGAIPVTTLKECSNPQGQHLWRIAMQQLPHAGDSGKASGNTGVATTGEVDGNQMNCIKRLGERVMPHTFERQVNELHIRAATLNRFTGLGHPQTAGAA